MTYREQIREAGVREWRRYPPEMSGLAWKSIPKEEKSDILRIVERAMRQDKKGVKRATRDWAVTRMRLRTKAEKDAEIDHRTRVLIGARVPKEKGEEVKQAAARTGRSVYRFVMDALERELERSQGA